MLAPPFNALAAMLGVGLLRDLVMFIPRYDTHAYAVIWECSLVPLLAAQAWAAVAALNAIARLYPKISRFAARVFLVCLATTALACCTGLPFEIHRIGGNEGILRTLFLLHRWLDSLIAGTLILTSWFFLRFPAPIKQPPRNLVMHTLLLTFYFSAYAVLFFAENLAPLGAIASLERFQSALVVVLYAAWAICITPKGEQSKAWPRVDLVLVQEWNQTAVPLLPNAATSRPHSRNPSEEPIKPG